MVLIVNKLCVLFCCNELAKMSEDYKTAHTKTAGEQLTYQNKAEGVHSVNHECSDVSPISDFSQ
jgi:hypothetical protein